MFYISEIYNHNEAPVVEATYSDISLTIVRDTDSNFYRGFTCAYDLKEQSAKIAGVGVTYLHAFNQYEVKLLKMMKSCGVDCDYPLIGFQKLPNTLQFDYLYDYGVFTLFKDARTIMHYTVLDLINTHACCVETLPNGSANIYIYCCFGNDFVKYFIQDYNQFILLYTKYNVFMKGRR